VLQRGEPLRRLPDATQARVEEHTPLQQVAIETTVDASPTGLGVLPFERRHGVFKRSSLQAFWQIELIRFNQRS